MSEITVHFRLYSLLKHYARQNGLEEDFCRQVASGSTLLDVREQLGVPARRIGRFVCQGKTLSLDYVLQDQDAIDVLPPTISGG